MTESDLQQHELDDDVQHGADDYHDPDDDAGSGGGGGEDSEIEARARRQGWVPEAEWDDARAEAEGRRKPSSFVTAREFLDRIEQSAPMMRERLRKSDEAQAELTRKLDEVSEVVKWQAKQSRTQRQKAYEQGIKDAEAKKREAVSEADQEKYDEAEAERLRLEEEAKEQGPPGVDDTADPPANGDDRQKGKIDPDTDAWIRANPWFQNDMELNGAMIKRHNMVLKEMPGLSVTESLNEAKRRVIEKFPEEFGKNPRRQAPGAVSHPSGDRAAGRSSAQQRFKALPAEDRHAFERHKKMFADKGDTYTIEQFLEDYE